MFVRRGGRTPCPCESRCLLDDTVCIIASHRSRQPLGCFLAQFIVAPNILFHAGVRRFVVNITEKSGYP